ncbi:hypothetical protein GCM10007876_04800 [Litoribrevibacter albus]|uniref:Uncharacterized protein n=1 Tax=Litoribrevibacter albus TaxID=1473156 RepID=A0AA37S807_9GAMM|nr:hypothetical protein GCM10007876_04800 [Litoribrevibacter albus]
MYEFMLIGMCRILRWVNYVQGVGSGKWIIYTFRIPDLGVIDVMKPIRVWNQ